MTIKLATDTPFTPFTDEEQKEFLLEQTRHDLSTFPTAYSSELYFLQGCMNRLINSLEAQEIVLADLNERLIYIKIAKGYIPKDMPQKLEKSLQKIELLFQKFREYQASYKKGDFKNQNTQPVDELFTKFTTLHTEIPKTYSKLKKELLPQSSCLVM